jgi:predicted glycoside hydrolase/deacetylase ChbG (UPF0249 family)
MDATRFLIVVADDFGIGPETSHGILEAAARGAVTASVLLAHSPHAADAVRAWRQAGSPMELGWHPCLTLDAPCAGAARVPSLVGRDGRLWPLPAFLIRLAAGLIRPGDVERELTAQYECFRELTGGPPPLANAHQHVALFPPVGTILRQVLRRARPLPYLRRVREPTAVLAGVPGAKLKRASLSTLGRLQEGAPGVADFLGADWLMGVTDPPCVQDPEFLVRWLARMPGRSVELTCHPGRPDDTLAGRDGPGPQPRRAAELRLLLDPSFDAACRRAGFVRVAPSEWLAREAGRRRAA